MSSPPVCPQARMKAVGKKPGCTLRRAADGALRAPAPQHAPQTEPTRQQPCCRADPAHPNDPNLRLDSDLIGWSGDVDSGARLHDLLSLTYYVERMRRLVVRRREFVGWSSPPLLVLGALAGGPLHGYGIIQQVQRATGITLGAGTLYAALSRLEGEGLVRALPATDRRR